MEQEALNGEGLMIPYAGESPLAAEAGLSAPARPSGIWGRARGKAKAFFNSIFESDFFKPFGKSQPPQNVIEIYSVFKKFLDGMKPEDLGYHGVKQAVTLCDAALRAVRKRISLSNSISELNLRMNEAECYNRLTPEEAKQLKGMLNHYTSLSRERVQLLEQLTSFDKSLYETYKLEDQAGAAVPNIQNAEQNQRILRQDIGYLHGEKDDLEYERETLSKGLRFINAFVATMICMFVFTSAFLAYMYIFEEQNIFLPTSVTVIFVIVISSLLYIFRKRVVYELEVNLKKQQKAVGLINKKNVVYAYYTNFLKFTYRKYKVRSSQMLKSHLHDLSHYKHVVSRIDSVRKIMYETQEQIEAVLREKKLTGLRTTIEDFAKTVDVEDQKQHYDQLKAQTERAERELAALDKRHAEIWDMLMALEKADISEAGIVEKAIQSYIGEVSRLIENINENGYAAGGVSAASLAGGVSAASLAGGANLTSRQKQLNDINGKAAVIN